MYLWDSTRLVSPLRNHQGTVGLSRESYLTSKAGGSFSHSINVLFYVDGFMVIEGWKIGFNKSQLIEKIALPVLITMIFKCISAHSETI